MASEGYADMTPTGRTDGNKGREYRCDDCGNRYWTAWGNARRHTCDGEDAGEDPEPVTDGGEDVPEYREELQVVLTSGEDSAICNGAYTAMSAALNAATSLPGNTHVQSIPLDRTERVTVDGREFLFREYPARHPRERRQVEVVPDADVKQRYSEPRRWRYVFVLQDHSERVTWDGEGIHAALRAVYAPDPGNTNAGPDGYASVAVNGGTRVPEFVRDAVMEHLEIEGFGRPPFIPERDGEYSGMEPEPKAVSTDGSGLTKACPECDGAGEFVEVERDGRVEAVKGVTAMDRIQNGDWTYHGERECTNCSGYGHVDARTGEI